MLRNYISNAVSKYSFICQSLRGFKLWNTVTNSSNSLEKVGQKLSLAYYSFDPSYLNEDKPNPIILYHGLFTSKDMYQNIVKPLSQQTGRIVYLLDMRNHGESPHSIIDNSDLKTMANDVNDFMSEFKINKAVLIGHGVGSRAMLQMSLLYENKVEKVVAIDVSPVSFPLIGTKVTDIMLFTVASLPRNIGLSHARLIVKGQLGRFFRDKILLQYILMNLKINENGFVKWRFNLPVIKESLERGIVTKMSFDNQYSGEVLVICGKYGLVTAQDYNDLKNAFPNAKFNFSQRFRHFINCEQPKKLLKVLVEFVRQEK